MRYDHVTGDRTPSGKDRLATWLATKLLDLEWPEWLVLIIMIVTIIAVYAAGGFVIAYAAHLGWDAAA